MARCVIFCAGGFAGLARPLESGDTVIAADGGLRHTQALSLTPDIILGDFDSLGFVPPGANVFPVEKDDTDAMLAVRHGLSLGYRDFVIYGGLDGDRVDHTVANLQTLLFLAQQGATGRFVGRTQVATLLKNDTLRLTAPKGTVSVFALGGDASGVTIKNLHYEAENITLTPHFPLGVSNHSIGKDATISVADGTLLIIYDR